MRCIKFIGPIAMVAMSAAIMVFTGCKKADIAVASIKLSSMAETVKIGSTVSLYYTYEPAEAKVESAVWSTSAETVATVDQNGLVTGVSYGAATITITVNNTFTKTCTVTVVESAPIYTEGSYSGNGIKIGDTWWAPVNCGYDDSHTYGLLYQWGRKYGQAYEVGIITPEPLTKEQGEDPANSGKFGKANLPNNNWYAGGVDNTLWIENSKGPYDPCPSGWRVPTKAEYEALISQKAWGTNMVGTVSQTGYWFNGRSAASEGTGVFIPLAGYRNIGDGRNCGRSSTSLYWSSSVPDDYSAWDLYFQKDEGPYMRNQPCVYGHSVRCVLE